MIAQIKSLIEKQDTNEIIRDQIAAILTIEIANQEYLAKTANKDQSNFSADVYIERSRAWQVMTSEDDGEETGDFISGLINVCFDNDVFDNKNSNNIERQRAIGTFFIDCYGHKNKTEDRDGNTIEGDELSSKESDRIARLARNIIMSGPYTYLGFVQHGGLVARRYINKREKFLPTIDNKAYENVIGTRLTLQVEYDELSYQATGENLELLINTCEIGEDGLVSMIQEFDLTE